MAFFNIIIPTCNRPKELKRAIDSIKNQHYKNWRAIVVHDGKETHKEADVDKGWYDITHVYCTDTKGAGGTRNVGISLIPRVSDEYTLFLDDDDLLANDFVLGKLRNFISKSNFPDLIRLGYIKHFPSGIEKLKLISKHEDNIVFATSSMRIGPPTKCIKSSKLVPFRVENCKHQDVVQHIDQCDNCEKVAVWDEPYFIYNIYDRPDKAKTSPECQQALHDIPKALMEGKYRRSESKYAAMNWVKKIRSWYTLD